MSKRVIKYSQTDTNDIINAVFLIFGKLMIGEKKGKRVYVTNGEFDSNQTDYEQKVNNLDIIVKAKDLDEGRILHHFLRFIIDEHDLSFLLEFSFYDDDEFLAPSDLVGEYENLCDIVMKKESAYSQAFKSRKDIKIKMCSIGGGYYQKPSSNTKVYTLDKVFRMFCEYIRRNKEGFIKK